MLSFHHYFPIKRFRLPTLHCVHFLFICASWWSDGIELEPDFSTRDKRDISPINSGEVWNSLSEINSRKIMRPSGYPVTPTHLPQILTLLLWSFPLRLSPKKKNPLHLVLLLFVFFSSSSQSLFSSTNSPNYSSLNWSSTNVELPLALIVIPSFFLLLCTFLF